MNHRRVRNGSGYTLESSVKVKDVTSLVLMVAEAFIPFAGKRVRCWRCKGRGYYQRANTNNIS